jgi:hypothetical protein
MLYCHIFPVKIGSCMNHNDLIQVISAILSHLFICKKKCSNVGVDVNDQTGLSFSEPACNTLSKMDYASAQ